MPRRVLLAALALLLAGCAEAPDSPVASSTSSTAEPTSLGDPTELFNTTAPPPPDATYNQTFEFTVTYVSVAEGGGTNAAQPNCAYFQPITMSNATASVLWTARAPGEEQLELVVANFQGADLEQRVQGPSPLKLDFAYPLTDDPIVLSVQSTPLGAVQQLPVRLTVTFRHPAAEQPDVFATTCAL